MGALSASELAPKAARQEHLPVTFGSQTRTTAWYGLAAAAVTATIYGLTSGSHWHVGPGAGWTTRWQYDLLTCWGHPMLPFLCATAAVGVLLTLCAITRGFREGPSWTHVMSFTGSITGGAGLALPALVVLGWAIFVALIFGLVAVVFMVIAGS